MEGNGDDNRKPYKNFRAINEYYYDPLADDDDDDGEWQNREHTSLGRTNCDIISVDAIDPDDWRIKHKSTSRFRVGGDIQGNGARLYYCIRKDLVPPEINMAEYRRHRKPPKKDKKKKNKKHH